MGLPAPACARAERGCTRGGVRLREYTGFSCWQAGRLHRFGAVDLTGLEGGEDGGLYAGLGGGFCGPWRAF